MRLQTIMLIVGVLALLVVITIMIREKSAKKTAEGEGDVRSRKQGRLLGATGFIGNIGSRGTTSSYGCCSQAQKDAGWIDCACGTQVSSAL